MRPIAGNAALRPDQKRRRSASPCEQRTSVAPLSRITRMIRSISSATSSREPSDSASRIAFASRSYVYFFPGVTPESWYVELVPGTWRNSRNVDNDYGIDREMQRSVNYTGIQGNRAQDGAVTESMGTIYDRSHEHLGTSDSMIIRTRRRWLAVARAFEEQGIAPPNVDNPKAYRLRSGEVVLHRSLDWWDGSASLREKSLAEPPELKLKAEAPAAGS